jgi:hypothetical protein
MKARERKGDSMDPEFIIATLLERRNGIDTISKAWDRKTHFADPDYLKEQGGTSLIHLPAVAEDEPEIIWDSVHPEPGSPDRVVPLKNKDKHRKTIVSNRVQAVDPNTNTRVRLESGLEAGAMAIFLADRNVVAIRPQYGPVWFKRDGEWHKHYFDLCVDYRTGRRGLYAVRNEAHAAEVAKELELICNYDLHNHADFAELWTEKEISKPTVYRASEIVRARRMNNEGNTRLVMKALIDAGGRSRVYDLISKLENVMVSCGWTALWSLIARGLVEHHHAQAHELKLEFHSWVRLVPEVRT